MRVVLTRGSMSLSVEDGGLPPRTVTEPESTILAESERLIRRYHDAAPHAMCQIALAPCSPFSVTRGADARDRRARARPRGQASHPPGRDGGRERVLSHQSSECAPSTTWRTSDWLADDVWLAHGIHFTQAEVERLGAAGTGVCHCPSSNMRAGFGHLPGARPALGGRARGSGRRRLRIQRFLQPDAGSPPGTAHRPAPVRCGAPSPIRLRPAARHPRRRGPARPPRARGAAPRRRRRHRAVRPGRAAVQRARRPARRAGPVRRVAGVGPDDCRGLARAQRRIAGCRPRTRSCTSTGGSPGRLPAYRRIAAWPPSARHDAKIRATPPIRRRLRQIEVGIGRLEGRAMALGAGRDDDVGGRNGDSARPCPPRKRMRRAPDLVVDGELGQGAGKVLEDASLPLPARIVPELELNQRAPARPPDREGRLDAGLRTYDRRPVGASVSPRKYRRGSTPTPASRGR